MRKLVLLAAAVVAMNVVIVSIQKIDFGQHRTARVTSKDTGFHLCHFENQTGVHRYTVFLPFDSNENSNSREGQPNEPPGSESPLRPALVFLNGHCEGGDDGVRPVYNGLAERIRHTDKRFPFVVAFLQCHDDEAWTGTHSVGHRAIEMIDELVERFDVDPDRIYLTGLSSGGSGVWDLASRHPERFAAIVPVSATTPPESARLVAEAGLPAFVPINRFDASDYPRTLDMVREMFLKSGTEFWGVDAAGAVPREEHNSWDYTFRNPRLYPWLLRHSASSRVRQHAVPLMELSKFKDPDFIPVSAMNPVAELILDVRLPVGQPIRLLAVTEQEIAWNCSMLTTAMRDRKFVGQFGEETVAAVSRHDHRSRRLRCVRSDGLVQIFFNEWLAFEGPVEQATVLDVYYSALKSTDSSGTDVAAEVTSGKSLPQDSEIATLLRDVRGTGLEAIPDDRVPAKLPTARPMPVHSPDLTVGRVVQEWKGKEHFATEVSWKTNATGDSRWSAIHAAGARETTVAHTSVSATAASVKSEWAYPMATFDLNEFNHGLNRAEHVRWMHAFPDVPEIQAASWQFQEYSSGQHHSSVFPIDELRSGRTIVTANPAVKQGETSPAELFSRVPELVFQPFSEFGFNMPTTQLELLPELSSPNGHPCVVLQKSWFAGDVEKCIQYHLDRRSDCLLTRLAYSDSKSNSDIIDILYDDQSGSDVQLKGWRIASLRNKDPISGTFYPGVEAVVHFGEAEIVESLPEIPEMRSDRPATIVSDRMRGTWSEIQSDGTARPLTQAEIMAVKAGNLASLRLSLRMQQLTVLAIVGLLMFLAVRRWRGRKPRVEAIESVGA